MCVLGSQPSNLRCSCLCCKRASALTHTNTHQFFETVSLCIDLAILEASIRPPTWRFACFCLLNTGTKAMYHHVQLHFLVLN